MIDIQCGLQPSKGLFYVIVPWVTDASSGNGYCCGKRPLGAWRPRYSGTHGFRRVGRAGRHSIAGMCDTRYTFVHVRIIRRHLQKYTDFRSFVQNDPCRKKPSYSVETP